MRWRVALLFIVMMMVNACNTNPQPEDTFIPVTEAYTPTPDSADATPIPTIVATPAESQNLRLWLPDTLISANPNENATDMLTEQIVAFSASESGVPIEIRRKQLRDLGGIMPTLRAAREVAPGVIPDLVLVRRDDLLVAVQDGLILPLEGIVSSAIIGDLFSSALQLGQVNNDLYGLPYILEIQHVVYVADGIDMSNTDFNTYLDNDIPFLFPAARANGLNDVFRVQYLAAGATLNESGNLVIDEAALLGTLQFYEDALAKGLVSPRVLDYTRSEEYRNSLVSGEFSGAAVVNTELFLQLVAENENLAFVSIPTQQGLPVTGINGWLWVLTTADPTRQARAAAFLEWMMDADRQGAYVRTLNLLPSQRSALRRAYDADYAGFVSTLLPNATLPVVNVSNSFESRAIQAALASVLNGERTAAEATQDVMNQLSS